jgi:hypothetical protein
MIKPKRHHNYRHQQLLISTSTKLIEHLLILLVLAANINPTSSTLILKSQFLINTLNTSNNIQTVFLLNKTELNLSTDHVLKLIDAIPIDALRSFRLSQSLNNQLVYLNYKHSSASELGRISTCVLLLSNEIAVNVTFVEWKPVSSSAMSSGIVVGASGGGSDGDSELETESSPFSNDSEFDDEDFDYTQRIRFNIEYIFKLDNRSRFGLIKDDMPVNAIICIVRIFETQSNHKNDSDLVELRIGSDFFQVNIKLLKLI